MLLSPVVLAPVAPTFGGKFSRAFHVVCLLLFWHRLLQLLVGSFPAHFMLLSSHVLGPAAAFFGRKFSRAFPVGAMNIYFKSHRPSLELIFLKNRVTGFIVFPLKKTVRVTNEIKQQPQYQSCKKILSTSYGLQESCRALPMALGTSPFAYRGHYILGYIELCN